MAMYSYNKRNLIVRIPHTTIDLWVNLRRIGDRPISSAAVALSVVIVSQK